ncbi:hypothetical protein [Acetobacter nitrogenifigens]|uniref:hypothetical protein n=1 Tax=Acetobacter nitrogenifigens TaxID=285268 RepID=UPI0004147D9A|nr:hypothetical protein [Acetobacter nitrogenifigens]
MSGDVTGTPGFTLHAAKVQVMTGLIGSRSCVGGIDLRPVSLSEHRYCEEARADVV